MGVIDTAVAWALEIAADDTHGYSQDVRWGPSYDCSSFVISAYEEGGLALKAAGASWTGNMRNTFLTCGFADVTAEVVVATGARLEPGDVLLDTVSEFEFQHTAMYVGDGKLVHAKNAASGILVENYYNGPWPTVLRYIGETPTEDVVSTTATIGTITQYNNTSAETQTSYYLGTTNNKNRYRLRIAFTVPKPCSKVAISLDFADGTNINNSTVFYAVITSSSSGTPPESGHTSFAFTANTYTSSFTITQNLSANTTYYLWLIEPSSFNYFVRHTKDTGFISIKGTVNTYKVTFNPNGGSVSPTGKTVTYGEPYGTLPTPQREGYGFLGWYTAASGGSKITATSTVSITANQTLYAHWEALSIIRANVGGTWKTCTKIHVNVGGTWRQALGVWANVGGTWKRSL